MKPSKHKVVVSGDASNVSSNAQVFINYTHPSQRNRKEVRFAVRSHVAGHFGRKNRQIVLPTKKPRQWLIVDSDLYEGRTKEKDTSSEPEDEDAPTTQLKSEGDPLFDNRLCSLRADPFGALPIKAQGNVPVAIDFCKLGFL